jgi:hypothetical protein
MAGSMLGGYNRNPMVVVTILVLTGLTAAPLAANAQTPYDGTWNVTIETKAGNCDPTARYAVTVLDGKVSGPASVTGSVSRSGNVRVSMGPAYASGQLEGSAGSGKWNAASSGVPCSGKWEASKQ